MSSQQLVDFIHEQLKSVSVSYITAKLCITWAFGYEFLNDLSYYTISHYYSYIFLGDLTLEHVQENKLSTICERVFDKCLAPSTSTGEGCDNMTMILVQFKKPIEGASPAEEQDNGKLKTTVEEQEDDDSKQNTAADESSQS